MTATFDGELLICTLSAPTNGVLVQDVQQDWYKVWKIWQLAGNMRYPPMFFDSFGGDDLTPGIQAGAYFKFQNQRGWRIRASEANQTVYIAGNLTPADSSLPITIPTIGAYTVMYAGLQPVTQNVDLIINEQRAQILSLRHITESLRPNHKGYGNIWYWDALNGSDTYDGKSQVTGFKTFAYAHSQATDWGHDVIFVVPFVGMSTILTEPMTITKNFIFIRGAGYNTHFHPTTTTAGGNLIEISGKGVEISGFHIEGVNIIAPDCNGIYVTGDHVLIKDLTIEECTGNGIVITVTEPDDHSAIENSTIRQNGKSGMQINSAHYIDVKDSSFEDNTLHGVELTGTGTTEDALFHHANFHGNGGYGIKINNASVISTTIEFECLFSNNTLGDILDNGTNTINQRTINDATTSTAIGSRIVEGTFTMDEVMRLIASALAGKVSGAGTGTETFRDLADSKPRITFTTDANGNRTGIVRDVT